MKKTTFLIAGKHAVTEALKNPNRKVLKVFLTEDSKKTLNKENPNLLIVQGDTTTVAVSALIAYYEKIPIGHVEAGLRTFNLNSPFPEEGNRQIVSRISDYNWAPTLWAAKNLKKENAKNIFITGATGLFPLFTYILVMHLSKFLGIGKTISGLLTIAFFFISLKLALAKLILKNKKKIIKLILFNFFNIIYIF